MDSERIYKKYDDITRALMIDGVRENVDKNIVISPFSIIMLLMLLADSTSGNTHDEIVGLISGDLQYDRFKDRILKLFECIPVKNMSIANAVIVDKRIGATVKSDYQNKIERVYDARLFSSDDIVRDVNRWVDRKTGGLINHVIDRSVTDTLVGMINAVAFESKWAKPYSIRNTMVGKFNNSNKSISDVIMTYGKEKFFIENEEYTGFIKNYEGYNFAFMGLLPKDENLGITEGMINNTNFTELYDEIREIKCVNVKMPEFKYDFTLGLKQFLLAKGIKQIYSENADFSPLSDEWLELSDVIHKARIEVDREGTRAAALTCGVAAAGAAFHEPPKEIRDVILDRPFVFEIIHIFSGVPIFTGVVNCLESMTEEEKKEFKRKRKEQITDSH